MQHLARLRALPSDQRQRVIAALPEADQRLLIAALHGAEEAAARTKFYAMFPDRGPHRRELYHWHCKFFADGAWAQYRAFIGGNGTGKTEGGGFELVCHLTGEYPEWWKGHRFDRPIRAWCAGDTTKTVRNIIQRKLLGTEDHRTADVGTGIIPGNKIGKVAPSNQLAGLADSIEVRHVSGKWSKLELKSYEQGRDAFQGTEIDFIWLDEQCPTEIYEECVHRFRGASVNGRLILTFTGLKGATDVALKFLPELAEGVTEETMRKLSCARVVCAMQDVPHLSAQEIAQKLGNTTGAARETRRTGIPYTGSGRIYKVDESVFVVQPFDVPKYWARQWSADFGFGSEENGSGTACVWGAWDRENDVIYVYDEYFQPEMPRSVHAAAIKGRGDWMEGVGDYAGKADNGDTTMVAYKKLGLLIHPANKVVEAGIDEVTDRLSQGRLKVFANCTRWLSEYRVYQFAPNGTIKKERDHVMDATRYLVMSGMKYAKTKPIKKTSTQGTGSVDFFRR